MQTRLRINKRILHRSQKQEGWGIRNLLIYHQVAQLGHMSVLYGRLYGRLLDPS